MKRLRKLIRPRADLAHWHCAPCAAPCFYVFLYDKYVCPDCGTEWSGQMVEQDFSLAKREAEFNAVWYGPPLLQFA